MSMGKKLLTPVDRDIAVRTRREARSRAGQRVHERKKRDNLRRRGHIRQGKRGRVLEKLSSVVALCVVLTRESESPR